MQLKYNVHEILCIFLNYCYTYMYLATPLLTLIISLFKSFLYTCNENNWLYTCTLQT